MKILLKFGIGADSSTFGLPRFTTPRYEMGVFKTGVFKTGKIKMEFAENLGKSSQSHQSQVVRLVRQCNETHDFKK